MSKRHHTSSYLGNLPKVTQSWFTELSLHSLCRGSSSVPRYQPIGSSILRNMICTDNIYFSPRSIRTIKASWVTLVFNNTHLQLILIVWKISQVYKFSYQNLRKKEREKEEKTIENFGGKNENFGGKIENFWKKFSNFLTMYRTPFFEIN